MVLVIADVFSDGLPVEDEEDVVVAVVFELGGSCRPKPSREDEEVVVAEDEEGFDVEEEDDDVELLSDDDDDELKDDVDEIVDEFVKRGLPCAWMLEVRVRTSRNIHRENILEIMKCS